MEFFDQDGNILVPKTIRPIIEYDKTVLGNRNGSLRQFRYNKLHIREYEDHYSIHMDKFDPRTDPIKHLLADAPEYLASLIVATDIGTKVGKKIYENNLENGKEIAIVNGVFNGMAAGIVSFLTSVCFISKLKTYYKK